MRSLLKDAGRLLTTVHTVNTILGVNANGSGIFSDGTPWQMIRDSTGVYRILFDPKLIPINVSLIGFQPASGIVGILSNLAPGVITISTVTTAEAAVSTNFKLVVNWLDTRV